VIAAVILAAGSGRRMGGPKALLDVNGESLLQRAVRIAREAGCDPVVAVVGDWDSGPLAARIIHNPASAEGLASSLRAGITALPPEVERALVMTVDQLAVDAPLLARLLALSAAHPDQPAACSYADTLGVPAAFPRRLFAELGALRGDHGAKAILLHEATSRLAFPEGVADVDTPEDLSRFKR
jgi:CTP:molybdopterin cytidylyltransferase MocA